MRSYPKYDLDSTVEVAKRLHEHGGQASAVELAAILGYKGTNNGAYLNRVAATRGFGLIEGEGKGAVISVTGRALNILQPDYEATEARARLDAFTAIPLYADFLERYEGQPLPDQPGMRNALISMGIPEKNAALALSRLTSSAHQAGLFKVAPNKLIRPTLVAAAPGVTPETPILPADNGTRRHSKLIDALIEELPSGREWDEPSFEEWRDMFERALRIHYRLPRSAKE